MEGQYTTAELLKMGNIISTANSNPGLQPIIIRKVGNTINYYCQHYDGSWTNYDCKTKY